MISWIQNHLIRHGRWIFLTLLGVVIVAFVFTIGNTPGCTTDRSAYEPNEFYGYDLNSPRDMQLVGEKVSLSSVLNTGRPPQSEQQFQSMATARIAQLHLADLIGVPGPDQAALTEYIKTKAAFRGADGAFSPEAYTRFVDNIEANPSVADGLVIVVLEEDYRIDQVSEALGGPGFILPAEAISQTRGDETVYDLATAALDFNEFDPVIEPDESALRAFYQNNGTRYEVGERIRAGYVLFPTENFLSEAAEPAEAELRAHFIANRARFVDQFERQSEGAEAADPAGEDAAEDPVAFEDVRDAVAAELIRSAAKRAANVAAQQFAATLYREDIAKDSEAFDDLLSENSAEVTAIEPYTVDQTDERSLPAQLLEAAFTLGSHRYYSDPYELPGGFAVLIYDGRIDPEIPPFEVVSEAVEADYLAQEKRRLFNEKGAELRTQLADNLSSEASFMEAADELGLRASNYEPFKPETAPADLPRTAVRQAALLEAGELSPMVTSGGSGLFVFLADKTVPEIDPENEAYQSASEFLERYASFVGASALLNELITAGISATEETADSAQ